MFRAITSSPPIVAIIMEWVFATKGERGPCPRAKVVELTDFLLSCDYVPFSMGIVENSIVKLDTSKHGLDWHLDTLIWLRGPSMPVKWAKNDTIEFSFKMSQVFI